MTQSGPAGVFLNSRRAKAEQEAGLLEAKKPKEPTFTVYIGGGIHLKSYGTLPNRWFLFWQRLLLGWEWREWNTSSQNDGSTKP